MRNNKRKIFWLAVSSLLVIFSFYCIHSIMIHKYTLHPQQPVQTSSQPPSPPSLQQPVQATSQPPQAPSQPPTNHQKYTNSIILNEEIWNNTPSITIMCRLYGGAAFEYYNIFTVGYLLFWPYKKWANSEVAIIFDDENENDHMFGTILANLPPHPKIYFEKRPAVQTFCSGWRREGYSRQQYSNFYSDFYSANEFIGIVDSDAFFATPVTPEDLFVNGKPRVFGYNGCCTGWETSLGEIIGGEVIGALKLFIITFNSVLKWKLKIDRIE